MNKIPIVLGCGLLKLIRQTKEKKGLALIGKSLEENRPYSLAFVDVRMPPGWDGIHTIRKMWQEYPDLEVVLCTGFADRPWEAMVKSLGFLDRLIVLIKPFEALEVKQLAVGLSEKWRLKQQSKLRVDKLERLVRDLAPLKRESPQS
jgi:DNA-binding LytR/AlgR family response regulator